MISRTNRFLCLVLFFMLAIPAFGPAGDKKGRVVKAVPGEGTCIIDDITAREARQLALRRARAAAIETAAGIRISTGTVVRDSMLAADFIQSYSRGYIINERVQWLPLRQHQPDPETAPIPEYQVIITADVFVPESGAGYNLEAGLNKILFSSGDKLTVTVEAAVPVSMALFNIMANDQVVMLYPNRFDPVETISKHQPWSYPGPDSPLDFTVMTLPEHKRNSEAVFVVATSTPEFDFKRIFTPLTPLDFTEFFKKYADIAHQCRDIILPYVVIDE